MPGSPPPFIEPALGIVFDLDGTLVDSGHDFARMRKTVVQTAGRYGVMPGKLSVTDTVPVLMRQAVEALELQQTPDGVIYRFENEANEAIDRIEMEALPRTTALPHSAALLRALNVEGFRLGLLTRSSEKFARAALHQTGLLPYFPFLRSRSSPGPVKPNPAALRLLLETMGVPPERAVLVGDHFIDCECAIAAQVRFYAVLLDPTDRRYISTDRFQTAGATGVAKDLLELGGFFGVHVPVSRAAPAR